MVQKMELNRKIPSLNQYCEITSCMGITDCYLAKPKFGKIFWAIIVIVGLAVTTYLTIGTLKEYLNDSDFKISLSREYMQGGIPFPFITICNFNRAKQSIINQTNLDPKVLSYVFQMFPSIYDIPLSMDFEHEISEYQQAWDNYVAKTGESDIYKFLQRYSHGFNDSVAEITFATEFDIKNFTEVFTIYGRCWRVNVEMPQTTPGSTSGIKMILNPQLKEYMTDVLFNNYYQQGFAISLNYREEPLMSDIIMLPPGTTSNIVIKANRNIISKTPHPTKAKPCRENSTLKFLKTAYTPQNCIFDCYIQALFERNGCILLAETHNKMPLCNLSTAIDIVTPLTSSSEGIVTPYTKYIVPFILNCSKDCRNSCEEFNTVEATPSITTNRFTGNSEQAIRILQQNERATNWSYDYVRDFIESIIVVKIYFSSTAITVVETGESTPIMTLIGNIGGQLGLWMGISMCSIIQLLYYVVLALINGECWYKPKKANDICQE